jgi:hypothetical protein
MRQYTVEATDPLQLARDLGVPLKDVSLRLGVTADWMRRLAHDFRSAGRVRRAVLELALERERLGAMLS